jgi:HSP20 family molecular chaperone IbpA
MTRYLVPSTRSLLDEADLLFRDLFNANSLFQDIWAKPVIQYPLDVKETNDGLEIDVAAVDMDKKDIDIEVKEGNILCVSHEKEKTEVAGYIYKGITNKSFSLAWKISTKFDLTKIDANLDRGLLKIRIPIAPEKQSRKVEVK